VSIYLFLGSCIRYHDIFQSIFCKESKLIVVVTIVDTVDTVDTVDIVVDVDVDVDARSGKPWIQREERTIEDWLDSLITHPSQIYNVAIPWFSREVYFWRRL